jgi:hypothetical protein
MSHINNGADITATHPDLNLTKINKKSVNTLLYLSILPTF